MSMEPLVSVTAEPRGFPRLLLTDASPERGEAWFDRCLESAGVRHRENIEDPRTNTFGEGPCGVIGYHDNGLVHVQIYARQSGPEWTHVGYIGRYTVREARRISGSIVGVLEHHMQVAYPVELLSEDPDRPFTLKGDHLTLGDGETAMRTFERVEEQ